MHTQTDRHKHTHTHRLRQECTSCERQVVRQTKFCAMALSVRNLLRVTRLAPRILSGFYILGKFVYFWTNGYEKQGSCVVFRVRSFNTAGVKQNLFESQKSSVPIKDCFRKSHVCCTGRATGLYLTVHHTHL